MNYLSKGSQGDIISAIPTIIANGGGNLYLRKEEHYNNLNRLLDLQPNVKTFIYNNDKIDVRLDEFRPIHRKNPSKLLTTCHLEILGLKYDLTKPWIKVNPNYKSEIVINVTPRYHNEKVSFNWRILEKYKDRCAFVGTNQDYDYFTSNYKFDVKRLETKDALDMAEVVAGSKFVVGNQSLFFWLAEAMKHNRFLERFTLKDNVFLESENCWDEINEELINNCFK